MNNLLLLQHGPSTSMQLVEESGVGQSVFHGKSPHVQNILTLGETSHGHHDVEITHRNKNLRHIQNEVLQLERTINKGDNG